MTTTMVKKFSVRSDGYMQTSFAEHQRFEPWVWLVGDCFFRNLHENFSTGPLAVGDCPFTLSLSRSRIDALMDYVDAVLPVSAEWIVVHVGANNLASSKFSGFQAAAILLSRCTELLRRRPRLDEISICLLSPRLTDARGSYSLEYITQCNAKVIDFNRLILQWTSRTPKFTSIDFGLERCNLGILLRDSGFGVNENGRLYIAAKIQSIIIWKRISGRGPRQMIPRPPVMASPFYRDPRFQSWYAAWRGSTSGLSSPMTPRSSSDGW